jgi:thioredoxin-related protein
MTKVITGFLILMISHTVFGQKKGEKAAVPWLTVLQAQTKWDAEKRPVLVDVYTEWCVYCKVMDKTIWANPQVAAYVKQYFYPIKFNAESKEPASWMGKTYEFKPAYKVHLLAAEWLLGNMVYPSTVILPPNSGEPVIIPGVIELKELETILHYFGEDHYRNTAWKDYKSTYKPGWK